MEFFHVTAADLKVGSTMRYPSRVCVHLGPVDELLERTRASTYHSRNIALFLLGVPVGNQPPNHADFQITGATNPDGNIYHVAPSTQPTEHDFSWIGHLQLRFPNPGAQRLLAAGRHKFLIDPATDTMSCLEVAEAYWQHKRTGRPKLEFITSEATVIAKLTAAVG